MEIIMKNYKTLSEDEHKQILTIRNMEHIRNMSTNSSIIDFDNHIKWVKAKRDNDIYLAISEKLEICGGVNLTHKDNKYSWGIFFKPQTSSFLISCCTFSFLNFAFKKTDDLYALVKNKNKNALKFDKTFGFLEFDKNENFTFLKQNSIQWEEHKKTKIMEKILKISQGFDIKIQA